jgi:hypothetical protein
MPLTPNTWVESIRYHPSLGTRFIFLLSRQVGFCRLILILSSLWVVTILSLFKVYSSSIFGGMIYVCLFRGRRRESMQLQICGIDPITFEVDGARLLRLGCRLLKQCLRQRFTLIPFEGFVLLSALIESYHGIRRQALVDGSELHHLLLRQDAVGTTVVLFISIAVISSNTGIGTHDRKKAI